MGVIITRGDNLGNHTATENLDMADFSIVNVPILWQGAVGENYLALNDGSDNVILAAIRPNKSVTLTSSTGGISLLTTGGVTINDDVDLSGNELSGVTYLSTTTTGPASYIGMNSSLDFRNSQKIIQLINPVNAQDAATKYYVDDYDDPNFKIWFKYGDTLVWSCSGLNFKPGASLIDSVTYDYTASAIVMASNGVRCVAPVFLPHGATVTSVIVYGNISDETWHFRRALLTTGVSSEMATANLNSPDTSISNASINNNSYSYLLFTSTLDNTDRVYGAKIIYELTI